MLSEKEHIRYSRQIQLEEIGVSGQEKLAQSTVVIIGMGGLGCPAAQILAGAGVGTLRLVDFDVVSVQNLPRQTLYRTSDIGQPKVDCASQALSALNPHLTIETITERFTTGNGADIVRDADLVIDASDNLQARYAINDVCVSLNKPWVFGALYQFQAQLSLFNHNNGPSYRCVFPEKEATIEDNCSIAGVLASVPFTVGGMMAHEALIYLLGFESSLSGWLYIKDFRDGSEQKVAVQKQSDAFSKAMSNMNGQKNHSELPMEISTDQLQQWIAEGRSVQQIDIRELWETPRLSSLEVLTIPMNDLPLQLDKLEKSDPIVIICQHGMRSLDMTHYLREKHHIKNATSLRGGVAAITQNSVSYE